MNLRVVGFGACMVSGYPLPKEASFLRHAARKIQAGSADTVEVETVCLEGFPAGRAQKYLGKKVLSRQPDIVVLQFGSTDACAPLRRGFGVRQWLARRRRPRSEVAPIPARWNDPLKWKLRGLASDILFAAPFSTRDEYVSALSNMAEQCRAAGCAVVVLSPFVMGSQRSNRIARTYARALNKGLTRHRNVLFLDAHGLLSRESRRQVLLYDGFHLSACGHQVLGEALAEVLLQAANRPVGSSQTTGGPKYVQGVGRSS